MIPVTGNPWPQPGSALPGDGLQALHLRLGGQSFGLPASSLQSLTPLGTVTRLPGQPAGVLGLAQVRGRIIAVVDLCQRLQLPCSNGDTSAMRLVACITANTRQFGLGLPEAGTLVSLSATNVVGAPCPVLPAWAALVSAWYRGPAGLLALLDPVALCNFDTRQLKQP